MVEKSATAGIVLSRQDFGFFSAVTGLGANGDFSRRPDFFDYKAIPYHTYFELPVMFILYAPYLFAR